MFIVVDKMPKNSSECLFKKYYKQEFNGWTCEFFDIELCCLERGIQCPYLCEQRNESKPKMKQIRKKILPQYFKEVCAENKRFELRKDEDDVQVGDELILEEWEPENGYTGEIALRPVTYVLRNVPQYGLMDGYCIIGF